MPYLVNDELVPEALIQQETERLSRDLRWKSIVDETERARLLRAAAESTAIDRVLVAQAAVSDPRPIDSQTIEQELRQREASLGPAHDRAAARQLIDRNLRMQRITRETREAAAKPTKEEIETFYQANRQNFRNPPLFHAAHIVKNINGDQREQQARAGIETALVELERGAPFHEVADRHSDCKGNGGDLGMFPAGAMVAEFEQAIQNLEPGQRTGIFRTPFGFHIAELRAKREAGPASFEEVRADIERVLAMMSQHRAYLRAVAELRSRANIRYASVDEAEACAASAEAVSAG